MQGKRDFKEYVRKEYVRKELQHSPPTSQKQVDAHKRTSALFLELGEALAQVVPDGPDATKMVNYLTISRAWAQKSIAQNFEVENES